MASVANTSSSHSLLRRARQSMWGSEIKVRVPRAAAMTRATKIVATLGPASSDPQVLERLLRAGVDVVRLNFSHGSPEDHIARANAVREAAARVGKPVALMADLQGPKIRVGRFAEGRVTLAAGAPFVLDAGRTEPGDVS